MLNGADPSQLELKYKYKYRLILDESQSFGMVGAHGKGITEHYGVPVSLAESRGY
jgi:serine palmitoyltransferase